MFIMPTLTTKEPTIHESAVVDNKEVKQFLNSLDTFNYEDLPSWLDDVISGACGQVAGTQKFSPARLFNIISCLETISAKTIADLLNRKREALGEEKVSERYARYVASAARCASQAVAHHKSFRNVVIEEPVMKEFKPLPYSSDEMKVIKYLSLNAPFAELVAYEAQLKANYGIN